MKESSNKVPTKDLKDRISAVYVSPEDLVNAAEALVTNPVNPNSKEHCGPGVKMKEACGDGIINKK